jgi:hypothetical protein
VIGIVAGNTMLLSPQTWAAQRACRNARPTSAIALDFA